MRVAPFVTGLLRAVLLLQRRDETGRASGVLDPKPIPSLTEE